LNRSQIDSLDPTHIYWVAAVVAPERNWRGAPGCRKGARFMISDRSLAVSREQFEAFESQSSCLRWILQNRTDLNRTLPHATVRAVQLDRWLLGLD
jgi:hypothetical protein